MYDMPYMSDDDMKRENDADLGVALVAFAGAGLVLAGLWWCWPPLSIIAAGILLVNIAKVGHDRNKKQ